MNTISPKEFERFYRENYQSLIVFGVLSSSDRELTSDVVQDAMLDLWQRLEKGQQIQSPLAYLKISVRRELIRRKSRQRKMKAEENERANALNATQEYGEQSAQEERIMAVQQAMQQLSEVEREMLRLKYQRAYTYEEIAFRTGKSKRTIYNQVYNAIRKIQRIVKPTANLLLISFLTFF